MDVCLLCLEATSRKFITYGSKLWQEENIEDLIIKHLWPLKTITSKSWLCENCWKNIDDFHKFYMHVEEVQAWFSMELKTEDAEVTYYIEPMTYSDLENENVKELSNEIVEDTNTNDVREVVFIKEENSGEEEPIHIDGSPPNIETNSDPLEKPSPTKNQMCTRSTKHQRMVRKKSPPKENKENVDSDTDDRESIEDDNTNSPKNADRLSESSDSYSENETENEESAEPKHRWTKKDDSNFLHEHFDIECDICQIKLDTFFQLRRHFRQEHDETGYAVCCNTKFFRISPLVDHIRVHLNPEFFKCKHCGKVKTDRRALMFHIFTHRVREKQYVCEICNKAFARKHNLRDHMQVHLSDSEKQFPCEHCGKRYGNKRSLDGHIKCVHWQINALVCDICGEKMRKRSILERHLLQHQGAPLPTFSCEICGLKVSSEKGLRKHKSIQHPEGGKRDYPCNLCPKISPTLTALKKHIRDKHTSGYDFKCSFCEKAYKRADALKEHEALHTGAIIHRCPYCPKTSNSASTMYNHRKHIHPIEYERDRREKYSGKSPPAYKRTNYNTADDDDNE
ncbi:zinc finger protein 711-like [Haematobia irritans]|uniref:zinc finger protein 711-like n=1 Tax=Haematobia irritans TaxID=7368 RepID=UPI003F4F6385